MKFISTLKIATEKLVGSLTKINCTSAWLWINKIAHVRFHFKPFTIGRFTFFAVKYNLGSALIDAIDVQNERQMRKSKRWKCSRITFRGHLFAGTLDEFSHGAGSRNCISHTGCSDGIHEARLPGICKKRNPASLINCQAETLA